MISNESDFGVFSFEAHPTQKKSSSWDSKIGTKLVSGEEQVQSK
jgi:hypothetical protein